MLDRMSHLTSTPINGPKAVTPFQTAPDHFMLRESNCVIVLLWDQGYNSAVIRLRQLSVNAYCLRNIQMTVCSDVTGLKKCTSTSRQQPGTNFQSGFNAAIHHVVDTDVVSKSNHALCLCDLICLPVSSVGQRETRSCSEYTAVFYITLTRRKLEIAVYLCHFSIFL